MVEIDELTIGYSKKNPLVEIPRLEISSGEIIAITGPSGGKDVPYQDHLRLGGRP